MSAVVIHQEIWYRPLIKQTRTILDLAELWLNPEIMARQVRLRYRRQRAGCTWFEAIVKEN